MQSVGNLALPAFLALSACATVRPDPAVPPTSARAHAAAEDASSAALQADAARALERLRSVPAAEFQGADAGFRACMLERFGGDAPAASPAVAGDAFAGQVLTAYRAYWWRSLTHPERREAEEAGLLHVLQGLPGTAGGEASLDDLEGPLTARLERAGLHVLLGLTSPLREFMLWSAERAERRQVALPDGAFEARVLFLERFESLGWGDWATCGRHGAGGWADAETLYVVRPRYRRIDDEQFQVSFLAHETQHLADRRLLPGLEAWEMEYRAKLTELALADATREELLGSFAQNQGDDREVPHSYADRYVLADLRARLGRAPGSDLAQVPGPALREAARAVLRDDTRRHQERSPAG